MRINQQVHIAYRYVDLLRYYQRTYDDYNVINFNYQSMHFLVSSHKKSSVHGHE